MFDDAENDPEICMAELEAQWAGSMFDENIR